MIDERRLTETTLIVEEGNRFHGRFQIVAST
jgi:hypothetical protein